MPHDSQILTSIYKVQAPLTTVLCTRSVPDKLISFHREQLQQVGKEYKVFLLEDGDLDDLFAQLSMSFLGQEFIYTIKDADISAGERKKFDLFLRSYNGPHTVYFFTSDAAYQKSAILFETVIAKKQFQELVTLSHTLIAPTFVERLFALKSSYSFDEAITLLSYAHLLGSRHEQFFETWVSRILVDDISLFTLSQHLFAGQKKLLLQEWAKVKERYPIEFWVSYFSEQVWQAILYTRYAQKDRAAEAKRFTYRLPFSYFQKDWKRYSTEQLTCAHQMLYEIDYGLKNGYASQGIELFIARFPHM